MMCLLTCLAVLVIIVVLGAVGIADAVNKKKNSKYGAKIENVLARVADEMVERLVYGAMGGGWVE